MPNSAKCRNRRGITAKLDDFMFRRQKILLALLEQFDGELGRTQLQKLLFLYGQQAEDPVYEFVPYKYGCYSFQTHADKQKLTEQGLLSDSERWQLTTCSGTTYRGLLGYKERKALWLLQKQFGKYSRDDLTRHVYATVSLLCYAQCHCRRPAFA